MKVGDPLFLLDEDKECALAVTQCGRSM